MLSALLATFVEVGEGAACNAIEQGEPSGGNRTAEHAAVNPFREKCEAFKLVFQPNEFA